MATRQPSKVPGAQPPAPKGLAALEGETVAVVADGDEHGKRDVSDLVESLEQKVARLEAENQALRAAKPAPEPEAPETEDDASYRERARTLRAKDVDASRLKRAVLTVDGWVCPASSPAAPGKE